MAAAPINPNLDAILVGWDLATGITQAPDGLQQMIVSKTAAFRSSLASSLQPGTYQRLFSNRQDPAGFVMQRSALAVILQSVGLQGITRLQDAFVETIWNKAPPYIASSALSVNEENVKTGIQALTSRDSYVVMDSGIGGNPGAPAGGFPLLNPIPDYVVPAVAAENTGILGVGAAVRWSEGNSFGFASDNGLVIDATTTCVVKMTNPVTRRGGTASPSVVTPNAGTITIVPGLAINIQQWTRIYTPGANIVNRGWFVTSNAIILQPGESIDLNLNPTMRYAVWAAGASAQFLLHTVYSVPPASDTGTCYPSRIPTVFRVTPAGPTRDQISDYDIMTQAVTGTNNMDTTTSLLGNNSVYLKLVHILLQNVNAYNPADITKP